MNEEKGIKNLSSVILDSLRVKGLSIERLSQLSGVSERFLNLLIEGKYEKLPSRPYAHGYLVKISEVLNIDGEKLWQEFLKNEESIKRSGKNDQLPQNRFAVSKFNKKTIIVFAVILLMIVYALVKVPSFLSKPQLILQNLKENEIIVQNPSYAIRGKINPSDKLTLNNEQIYPNKEGGFEKSIELQPGFNTLTFKIKRFLGNEYVTTKQIFYQAPAQELKSPTGTNSSTQQNGN